MAIYTRRNAITFGGMWLLAGALLVGEKDDAGIAGQLAAGPQAAVSPAFSISAPQPVAPAAAAMGFAPDRAAEMGAPAPATPAPVATMRVQPMASTGAQAAPQAIAAYRGQSTPLGADPQGEARAALAQDIQQTLR